MKFLLAVLFILYSVCSPGQSKTDNWTQLHNAFREGNTQHLPIVCMAMITDDGVDIRTLLSILKSNNISLHEKWVSELFTAYNSNKKKFFQSKNRFYKIDSLFTEAYILHRNYKLQRENALKGYEQAHLDKSGIRISAKYQKLPDEYGYYGYLKEWLTQPDKTEEEVICTFIRKKGVVLYNLLSYQELVSVFPNVTESVTDFDTAFQKVITRYRIKSIEYERVKDIKTALRYRDSILVLNPFMRTSDAQKAKLLAMKNRLKDEYLHYLSHISAQAIKANPYGDTLPTFGRTKEDTAFVKLALKDPKYDEDNELPIVSYDLLMLSNRYAEQHDFAAGFAYPKQPLLENKNRKARLFVSYVMPSFTEYPYSIKFLIRSSSDLLNEINFAFSYVTIHLLQYNFRERLIEDSIFGNFLNTNAMLVNMKAKDVEDYYWLLDCYNTSVKHRESQYGWKLSEREDETIVDNTLTRENRAKAFLLPIEYSDN